LDCSGGEEREAEEVKLCERGMKGGIMSAGVFESAIGDGDEQEEECDGAANGKVNIKT
jgi:hypothetical protein